MSLLPNVRLGVTPLRRRIETAVQNSFVFFDDVVRVETFVADDVYSGQVATTYANVLDLLWQQAVEGDAARQLLIRAIADLRQDQM